MITEFGKHLRKIRIDHGEVLKNMADRLNVTSSFLSAIETGNRNVPEGWVEKIALWYSLSDEETHQLRQQAAQAVTSVRIELCKAKNTQRDAALVFARNFDSLEDETAKSIIKMLNGNTK